jgi:thymidylate synthase (FAD)
VKRVKSGYEIVKINQYSVDEIYHKIIQIFTVYSNPVKLHSPKNSLMDDVDYGVHESIHIDLSHEKCTKIYEILSEVMGKGALGDIEEAARVCMKSEDRINSNSKYDLVKKMMNREKAYAMLEFGGDIWVKFISNRGFSHQQVRHRLASYAQESTRINYSSKKRGAEIVFISPETMQDYCPNEDAFEVYLLGCDAVFRFCEDWYIKLKEKGVPTVLAREILPIGTKTEVHVKANFVEWRHIFNQRCSHHAHPRMRELMIPLLKDVSERIPIVFDDLVEKYVR